MILKYENIYLKLVFIGTYIADLEVLGANKGTNALVLQVPATVRTLYTLSN